MKKTMKSFAFVLAALAAALIFTPLSSQAVNVEPIAANEEADVSPNILSGPSEESASTPTELVGTDQREQLAANIEPELSSTQNPSRAAGKVLYLSYRVAKGDTLTRIANRFHTTVTALAHINKIHWINRIFVGQRLFIPIWVEAPPDSYGHHPYGVKPPDGLRPAVCNPLVAVTSPKMNEHVNGSAVEIRGTANLPAGFDPGSSGFSYYKVEFGVGESPILFNLIGNLHYNTVGDGLLTMWDTSVLPNGVYKLRLYAVSSRGNFPSPCEVRVVINR